MKFIKRLFTRYSKFVITRVAVIQKNPPIYKVFAFWKFLGKKFRKNEITFVGEGIPGSQWVCMETEQIVSASVSNYLNNFIASKFTDKIVYVDFKIKKRIT